MKRKDDDELVTRGYMLGEFRELMRKDIAEIVGEIVGDVLRLVDARFEAQDRKFDEVFARIDRIDDRFNTIDRRLHKQSVLLNRLERHVDLQTPLAK